MMPSADCSRGCWGVVGVKIIKGRDGWAGRTTLHDTDATRTHSSVHESHTRRTSQIQHHRAHTNVSIQKCAWHGGVRTMHPVLHEAHFQLKRHR